MVELLHGGGLLDLIDSEDFAFESSQTSANGFEMIGIKYSKGIRKVFTIVPKNSWAVYVDIFILESTEMGALFSLSTEGKISIFTPATS